MLVETVLQYGRELIIGQNTDGTTECALIYMSIGAAKGALIISSCIPKRYWLIKFEIAGNQSIEVICLSYVSFNGGYERDCKVGLPTTAAVGVARTSTWLIINDEVVNSLRNLI